MSTTSSQLSPQVQPQAITGIAPQSRTIHGAYGVHGWEGQNPDPHKGHYTKASGCPVAQWRTSLTAGPHGPILMEDHVLLEKIQHFTRSPVPPRMVHPLGSGAYGELTITNDISQLCKAKLFSQVGTKVPFFARFSGTFLEKKEAETNRDLRGFALKFYTQEGNWDLMTINTPVFAVRDAKVGPDNVHAFKRDPRTGEWNDTTIWDYVVTHPESIHQTLMIFTDRVGTPLSYRCMECWGCNTYSFYNAKNERFWIKYHLISNQGAGGLSEPQAKMIAGEDPDWLTRDLRESIEKKDFPSWKLCVQWMKEEEGYTHPYTFDCTKVWPHAQFPLVEVGTIVVNDLPINYHAETEQVCFSPANVIPGIGFSPDKLLQGRIMIYDDAQFHRMGPNFKQIPINRPLVEIHTNYVGGQHNHEYRDKFPPYYPSNFGTTKPAPPTEVQQPPIKCDGPADYYAYDNEGTDEDYYLQPRVFYKETLKEEERAHLHRNIATSISSINHPPLIEQIHSHLAAIDKNLSSEVEAIRVAILEKRKDVMDPTMQLWNELKTSLNNLTVPK